MRFFSENRIFVDVFLYILKTTFRTDIKKSSKMKQYLHFFILIDYSKASLQEGKISIIFKYLVKPVFNFHCRKLNRIKLIKETK